jgi:hypothetical protein
MHETVISTRYMIAQFEEWCLAFFLHAYKQTSTNLWRQVVKAPKIFVTAPRIFCVLLHIIM